MTNWLTVLLVGMGILALVCMSPLLAFFGAVVYGVFFH